MDRDGGPGGDGGRLRRVRPPRPGRGRPVPLPGRLAVAALALVTATPSEGLLLLTTLLLVALAAAGRFLAGDPVVRATGAAVLPLAAAGTVWAGGAVLDVDVARLGVPALLVVAALALLRPRPDTEGSALLAGIVSLAVAVPAATDVPLSLAVHLTLAGSLLSLTALVHPHRRAVGWAGSAVLTAALWVRLARRRGGRAGGLHPAARARARRAWRCGGCGATRRPPPRCWCPDWCSRPPRRWCGCSSPTRSRCAPCCSARPASPWPWSAPRCGGARRCWWAPWSGALLVLLELAPYVVRTPQWVVIGLAGTVLTLVGITWERRVVELRRAVGYVGRLR